MKDYSAVTRNEFKKGVGWYVGTVVKEESFYDRLIAKLLKDANLSPYLNLPYGVEASVRKGNGKTLLFLMNHSEDIKKVAIPSGKTNLLTASKTGDTIELGRFDVAVIEL